ncbi:MAG TPA: 2-oxoglutarate dehydrogenase E1 component [Verrucomicrobiae bacterium]
MPETTDSWNLPFVERLYADFARDPSSVALDWRRYFEQVRNGEHAEAPRVETTFPAGADSPDSIQTHGRPLQYRVNQLVRNYRVRGHNLAAVDPLGRPRPIPPELDINFYGFSAEDMDRQVQSELFPLNRTLTVREIFKELQDTYCRSIGVQYMHIDNSAIRRWLEERIEGSRNRVELAREEQVRIFTRLTDAVAFEEFIRKKFVGAKSFSLEGCESLIPLLDLAIEKAAEQGIKEIVLGMAHRGRLNVLANILGKSPRQIFREFADDPKSFKGHGDVKYHLGYSNDWIAAKGQRVHLSLCFNPSHLEFVNPVALGRARAKQDRFQTANATAEPGPCLALLIHGDASFAGQGVIQETLNLSQLPGYSVGGTVHVVVNNQIGFTTPPAEGRSCTYATDVARMLQVPIFHVNGEDPEAVAQVVRVAMDFRQTFHRDVFIDMFGYRRLGHNEGDEPAFTQPVLYRAIKSRKSVREGYLDHLLNLGGMTREEAEGIAKQRHDALERELSQAQDETYRPPAEKTLIQGIWTRSSFVGGLETEAPEAPTGMDQARLADLLMKQTLPPENFRPHPKIKKFLESRRLMAEGKEPLDWAAAEALAFACTSAEGFRVRLSGQDSARGTFSQRHAVLHDYESGEPYIPLRNLGGKQAPVDILNSPLSETGVLGFDYGYSLDCPDGLICWEAQYGDFVNSAQVIVDQFIASAEDKWNRLSGLVMLLPHGLEGQGPEHSSARIERFLNLGAADNIQIVCPTTPAQYFHCLRRQVVRAWRKPLIVMTPKSLLRDPQCVSTLRDCATGEFQRIIPDSAVDPQQVRRVLLCSGKIYYELLQQCEALQKKDVAIIRIEELYPLNEPLLQSVLKPFADGTTVWWVQEDPENMGAWRFLRARFGESMFGRFPFGGIRRPPSASPASGSAKIHKRDQKYLIAQAFADV